MAIELTEKQIRYGWQIVKFAEIANNISKRVEPSETDLKVYVGLEHLDPQSLRITRTGVPSDVEGQKLRVRPGQIIFGKRRAYQKKVAVADFDGICSAHAMVLEEIPKKIISGLLPYFMQSDMFMDRAVAISEGSLSPTIKWKTLATQEFPLPPLERQTQILEILKKIEEISLKNDNLIDTAETLSRALLKSLASNGLDKDNNFPIVDIATVINSPVDKKTRKGQKPVKLCNYVDVYNNREITANIDFMLATASSNEIERFSLNEGDVVITKDSETPDDIGVPAYIAENIPDLVCGYHLAILKPKKQVYGKYLSYVLSSRKARHEFIPYAQGMTRFGLCNDAYKRVKVYCPEFNKQVQIAQALDNIQIYIELLKKQSDRNMRKKSLILSTCLLNDSKNPEVSNGI